MARASAAAESHTIGGINWHLKNAKVNALMMGIIRDRVRFSSRTTPEDPFKADFVICFRLYNQEPAWHTFPLADYIDKSPRLHEDINENMETAAAWIIMCADNYLSELKKHQDPTFTSKGNSSVYTQAI